MSDKPGPIVIDTLGALFDRNMSARGYCGTHGGRDIDLAVMIARLGRDWRIVRRRWPIKCATCGGPLSVIVSPTPRSPGGSP